MNSRSFGLDIGTSTIKVVWLSEEGKALSLASCLAAPTPAKGMFSQSPFDQEEMVDAIRKVVKDAKISSKSVHIALADSQVFTKVIEMPALSDKELSSAIYWEAEQYIPSSLATMTLDWQVLKRPEQTGVGRMQVLLVAAQTELIKRYQELVEWAGFSLASVETEILSVIRTVSNSGTAPTALVINIGSLSTSLAILQSGVVVFTYSLPLGGVAMNRAIAADFGFSAQQAEDYRNTYGIADQTLGGKISQAIDPILRSTLAEVKKAMTFYSQMSKEQSPITEIYITGSTAKLPGLDAFFVRNTAIETTIANPWKTRNIQNVSKEVFESGTDYAIAIGLALKDYE